MNKKLTAATVLAVLLAITLVAPTASADHGFGWSAGAGFRIGPLRFHIVLGGDHDGHRGHYYRTDSPFHYGERSACSSRCFKDGDHYYHHPHCPGLLHHFDRYGVNPYANFDRYAPADDDRYYDEDGGSYGGYGRYDGYDDSWRHRRYEVRHHRRSCPPRYRY